MPLSTMQSRGFCEGKTASSASFVEYNASRAAPPALCGMWSALQSEGSVQCEVQSCNTQLQWKHGSRCVALSSDLCLVHANGLEQVGWIFV